jgi:hypothetical protein
MPAALWVHRLSADESGSPPGSITLDEVASDLREVACAVILGPREQFDDDADGARAFLHAELFERVHLRQGWGAPGMRLTFDRDA